ncbi:Uncharacterised protein [uncultured archaeon]|nr:Uncharacterised protein [uncultured archaeon]
MAVRAPLLRKNCFCKLVANLSDAHPSARLGDAIFSMLLKKTGICGFWSWRYFRQISFVHPEAMARALEASGCSEDDSEERKIFALTSYYSGILINPKSVREASDRLPEPEKLRFMTLDEAKARIARRTPAREALFKAVGACLAAQRDAGGGARDGRPSMRCALMRMGWEMVTDRLKKE